MKTTRLPFENLRKGAQDRGALWCFRVILVVAAIGLATYLVRAPKPWSAELARFTQGGEHRTDYRYFMWIGLWRAAAINLGLVILLLFVSPVVARFWCGEALREPTAPMTRRQRWILLSVIGVAGIIFSAHAIPRMGLSLWVDEETTARIETIGAPVRVDAKGRGDPFGDHFLTRPIPWSATIWNYHTANNHPFFSICSRLTSGVWNAVDPPAPLHFHEQALRLPAYLAALATLAVMPILLVRVGLFRPAAVVPLLMSVHPWFIRFGSDARGYALTFLFASLGFYFLWRALHDYQWRWWFAFGVAEFLLMWSHLSGMYFLIVLNLWGLAAPWLARQGASVAIGRNARLLLANLLAGMAFLQVFLPDFLEFRSTFVGSESARDGMGWVQVREMLSWLAGGLSWRGLPEGHPFSFPLAHRFDPHPWMLWAFITLLGGLFVLGLFAIWRLGGARRWLVLVIALPMPLMYALSYAQRIFLFDHYVVFSLPWILAGIAAGAGHCGHWLGRGKERLLNTLGPAIAGFVLVFWVAGPQRRAFCDHSLEPFRETVELTRGSIDPEAPGYDRVLTGGFLRFTRMYDKHLYQLKTAKDVRRLLDKSDATGKPLLVHLGQLTLARMVAPEVMAYFDDPEIFQPVTTLHGLDGMSEIWIIRHDPPSPRTPDAR